MKQKFLSSPPLKKTEKICVISINPSKQETPETKRNPVCTQSPSFHEQKSKFQSKYQPNKKTHNSFCVQCIKGRSPEAVHIIWPDVEFLELRKRESPRGRIRKDNINIEILLQSRWRYIHPLIVFYILFVSILHYSFKLICFCTPFLMHKVDSALRDLSFVKFILWKTEREAE